MVDHLNAIYPKDFHPMLRILGKIDWFKVRRGAENSSDELARSGFIIDMDALMKGTAEILSKVQRDNTELDRTCRAAEQMAQRIHADFGPNCLHFAYLETGARLVCDGPKLFSPTEEQFEAMEEVDLHIPIADFRSPFPAFVIRIPNEWRRRTAQNVGLPVEKAPLHIVIRNMTSIEGNNVIFTIIKMPGEGVEYYNVIQDNPRHTDLEGAIGFRVLHQRDLELDHAQLTAESKFCFNLSRIALNLCLMLVHFGHRVTGPLNPVKYKQHRKQCSEWRHGDFQAVSMSQFVIIRKHGDLPPGPVPVEGTGNDVADDPNHPRLWEVKPHWRRGHWRRRPGWQAFIERGEKPPLSFVRPVLVRKDRIIGDIGESQATYIVR